MYNLQVFIETDGRAWVLLQRVCTRKEGKKKASRKRRIILRIETFSRAESSHYTFLAFYPI